MAAADAKASNIQKAIAAEDQIISGFKPDNALIAKLRTEAEDQASKAGEIDELKKKAQKTRDKIAGVGAEREAFEANRFAVRHGCN